MLLDPDSRPCHTATIFELLGILNISPILTQQIQHLDKMLQKMRSCPKVLQDFHKVLEDSEVSEVKSKTKVYMNGSFFYFIFCIMRVKLELEDSLSWNKYLQLS